MAYTTLSTTAGFGFAEIFSKVQSGFVGWLENVDKQRVEPFRRQIAALHALSDEELAEKGLNRDDIEMRVLSGLFYC